MLYPDSNHMSRVARLMLGSYLVVLNLVGLALVFILWPGIKDIFPKLAFNPPDDIRLLLISTVCGALGSGLMSLVSFVFRAQNQMLRSGSAWWHVTRPITGMITGLFVYMAIRGGILKTGSGVSV